MSTPPRLPARFAPLVMALLLSIVMTMVVSGVSTLRGVGLTDAFLRVWLSAWGLSWLAAFPTLLLILPFVRRLTTRLCSG
ncbi:DUF2798 domain-containing protein [Brevundimonas sp. M20]|uniref:DUF2798 domain-containing protein n=1 Tax=Brevundimonas sp. M20 TaxID=2591463 RepID=UPI001F0D3094|nr:DUF2798 domain-containing protein [Brevundimonas sp. M20]